jgi:hypothetical protein
MGDWNWTWGSSVPSSVPSLNIGFAGTGETRGRTGFLFLLSQSRACTGIRSLLFCSARPSTPDSLQFKHPMETHSKARSSSFPTWIRFSWFVDNTIPTKAPFTLEKPPWKPFKGPWPILEKRTFQPNSQVRRGQKVDYSNF